MLQIKFRGKARDAMNWTDEVRARLKRNNQVLFAKDSEYLQELARLLQEQNHRVVTLWALAFAEETVAKLGEKYPEEARPQEALAAAWGWAAGIIKMRQAQRKILDCHAFAKEISRKEDIAMCHAVGQACAVVHTAGHAMGYPMYDLTAIVLAQGIDQAAEAVGRRKQEYIGRLLYWRENESQYQGEWADFMLR